MELGFLWAVAAVMTLLLWAWGRRNRRAGYQRPSRRALLEEGFSLFRFFEEPEPPEPAAPVAVAKETPVRQLMSLDLTVQSAAPATVEEEVEDAEVTHSPT